MNTPARRTAIALVASSLAFATVSAADTWQDDRTGFEPLLNHVPYTGPVAAATVAAGHDPFEAAFYAANERANRGDDDRYFARVDESFQRLLDHVPYTGPTEVTIELAADQVLLAVNETLRDSGASQLLPFNSIDSLMSSN